jgi:hypothetical protein
MPQLFRDIIDLSVIHYANFVTTVIPAKAGIQRSYSKCSWALSRNAGLVGLTGFRPTPE